MPAATFNITVEQGATFRLNLTWKDENFAPINLTGYSARMQIRPSVSSDDVLLSLTSPSNITLNGVTGVINVTASATQTSAIAARKGVYDLELESPTGVVTRLVQGTVTFSPEVTR